MGLLGFILLLFDEFREIKESDGWVGGFWEGGFSHGIL
jgi:hypothetical protein